MSTTDEHEHEKAFDALFRCDIEQIPTEFVVKQFDNKLFIIVTQYERMCNLFKVTFDEKDQLTNFGRDKVLLTISHHFGTDTDELRSATQFIVENTGLKKYRNDILISIGLKNINGKMLRIICTNLNNVLKLD